MRTRCLMQAIVLGVFLVLAGVLLLLQTYIDLSAWIWFVLLTVGGLAALVFFLADRSDRVALIAAYALLATALLLALIMLNVLRDEAVAVYVLTAVALPFLAIFARDRRQWWTLIPAYVLLAVSLMIALLALGVLGEGLVPAYVLFAIAVPFFAVYAWDRRQWWAIIPGGVLAAAGLFLLVAEAALEWALPVALILIGIWIIARLFARHRHSGRSKPAGADMPESASPEPDGPRSWDEG